MTGTRIIRLEACRGIAAMIVLARHLADAFFPALVTQLSGTPAYLFINGSGAVILFFVLSGYVLTVRFFAKHDSDYLLKSLIKRLPRLALLTTIKQTTALKSEQ